MLYPLSTLCRREPGKMHSAGGVRVRDPGADLPRTLRRGVHQCLLRRVRPSDRLRDQMMRKLLPSLARTAVGLGAVAAIGVACGSTGSTADQPPAPDGGAGASGSTSAGAGGTSAAGAAGSSSEMGGSSGSSTGTSGSSTGSGGASAAGGSAGSGGSGGSAGSGGSGGSAGGFAGSGGAVDAGSDVGASTTPPADAPRECGTQTCAADEWCQHPCCGTLPMCMAMPGLDGGACALGYQTCFTLQNMRGCQYSCTVPYCAKTRSTLSDCTVKGREVICRCA
jgi:hypothetical protein